MGGMFHMFDVKPADTSKRSSYKTHSDGLEAPRNSLEMPVGNSYSFHSIYGNNPYSKKTCSGKIQNLKEDQMKKLSADHSSTGLGRNVPGIVARLMGVDTLPTDVNYSQLKGEKVDQRKGRKIFPKKAESGMFDRSPLDLQPPKQLNQGVDDKNTVQLFRPLKLISKTRKVQSREHPQEEELQKFKKDFESWQATMSWERPKSSRVGTCMKIPKDDQNLAQELLKREKMSRYAVANANANQSLGYQLPITYDQILAQELLNREKMSRYADANANQSLGYQLPITYEKFAHALQDKYANEIAEPNRNQAIRLANRNMSSELSRISFERDNSHKISKPSRIVVLKPDSEKNDETEDSWPRSLKRDECSLEYFLDEVKERLRFEIQDNSRRSNTISGFDVETSFKERQANAKDIARHIANHVRENITRDSGVKLMHPKAAKPCKKEVKTQGKDSPDFHTNNARRFLSERLTNALQNETKVENSRVKDSRTCYLASKDMKKNPTSISLYAGREALIRDGLKDKQGAKSESFRHQERNNSELSKGDISPRSLVRSLSTPMSVMSFGKLLLEEPGVSTGAQIRRKLEADENFCNEVTRTGKERSSIMEKMSNLRYSLARKTKLFGKKNQFPVTTGEIYSDEPSLTTSTSLMSARNILDNSAEISPSPVSVCSSGNEDLTRHKDNPSPVSPLEAPLSSGSFVSNTFKEISSNLYELRQQLNRLQFDEWEEDGTLTEDDPSVVSGMTELECEAQIYIRDILVAAGLYDGCSIITKPIQNWVFNAVEDMYKRDMRGGEDTIHDTRENHKILFDLLNEILVTGVGPSTNRFKILNQGVWPNPGFLPVKILIEDIWGRLQQYFYPPPDLDKSVNSLMTYDLGTGNWLNMAVYEAECIWKDVEWMIWADLVGEITSDL